MGFEVAIPDTTLSEGSDLREKTIKAGRIARALAVFRVEHVIVYSTESSQASHAKDAGLLLKLLRYMDTPQYLRRRVFPVSQFLKYVGLLPPLRTRSHPLAVKLTDLKEGDVRWGIQIEDGKIDLGLDRPVKTSLKVGDKTPTIFRVIGTSPRIKLEAIERDDVVEYFGFEVESEKNMIQRLKESQWTTRVVFSRNGTPFRRLESDLKSTIIGTKSILAMFGGPSKGVSELFKSHKETLKENVEFWVNTVPDQGTETVRLDEAIFVCLSLLDNSVGDIITKPGFYH